MLHCTQLLKLNAKIWIYQLNRRSNTVSLETNFSIKYLRVYSVKLSHTVYEFQFVTGTGTTAHNYNNYITQLQQEV